MKIKIVIVNGILILFALSGQLYFAQVKMRTIEKVKVQRDEPIQWIALKDADSKPISLARFSGHAEWLKEVRMKIKNISNRRIQYIEVQLQIPLPDGVRQSRFIPLKWGDVDGRGECGPKGEGIPIKPIMPGDAVELFANADVVDLTLTDVRKFGLQDLDRVTVEFAWIVFDDDTSWANGRVLRRDPQNKKRWTVVGSRIVSLNSDELSGWRRNRAHYGRRSSRSHFATPCL